MRLLVCGGREYANKERVIRILDAVHAKVPVTLLIEGGAKGADRLAREWALLRGVPVRTMHANWDFYGKGAGHRRNAEMLSLLFAEGTVAFEGGTGTAGMVEMSKKAGIEVMEVKG